MTHEIETKDEQTRPEPLEPLAQRLLALRLERSGAQSVADSSPPLAGEWRFRCGA